MEDVYWYMYFIVQMYIMYYMYHKIYTKMLYCYKG